MKKRKRENAVVFVITYVLRLWQGRDQTIVTINKKYNKTNKSKYIKNINLENEIRKWQKGKYISMQF